MKAPPKTLLVFEKKADDFKVHCDNKLTTDLLTYRKCYFLRFVAGRLQRNGAYPGDGLDHAWGLLQPRGEQIPEPRGGPAGDKIVVSRATFNKECCNV